MEEQRRRERACKTFEGEWLLRTEQELHESVQNLAGERDPYMRANLQAYQETPADKSKVHHRNLGNYNIAEVLEERRKGCVEHGLRTSQRRSDVGYASAAAHVRD